MTHQPGPWTYRKGNVGSAFFVNDAEDKHVCLINSEDTSFEQLPEEGVTIIRKRPIATAEETARLIASAPALYQALAGLIAEIETEIGVDTSGWPILDAGRAALAKARGKKP